MPDLFLGLPAPNLNWSTKDAPHNIDHQDGYFSDEDGMAESRAVFLKGCHLPEAWQSARSHTLGELGFGTGLNFLCVWDLWRRTREKNARLHFVSIEAAPFSHSELRRAHSVFPELAPLSKRLLSPWPSAIKGVHRLAFDEDNIDLTLFFMDISEALPQMEMSVDGWFLDGFAPSRNADMWSGDVFTHLARLSRPGARAATFSVAGAVRRGLQNAGFSISRKPGYGRKRERLEALYAGPQHSPLRRPSRPTAPGNASARSVIIVGSGIAGASTAYGFLRRGIDTTLISKQGLADEASGNPAALVSPRLDLEDAPSARFFRTAFDYATRAYANLGDTIWHGCGLERLPAHTSDPDKFLRLLDAHVLPEQDLSLCQSGARLSLAKAGFVMPHKAIAAMTSGAKLVHASVCTLEREAGDWIARNAKGAEIARAPLAVLALGANTLEQTRWLSFRYLKGQVSTAALKTPYTGPALLAEGYALGLADHRLVFGATYEPVEMPQTGLSPTKERHQQNLDSLSRFAPKLAKTIDKLTLDGRVSIRTATPDQMPYLGPLPEKHDFLERFSALKDGFLDPKVGTARLHEGLFVLMGLGSRGFTLGPILGEALAAQALGEPSPLERGAAEALHPARVLERALKAGGQTRP
jgi:tRNA 5-methylaminomethyl-2-thiouridine biosynthesis bifunctional protein